MNLEQQLNYLDCNFTVISSEHEFIIHPSALGILPVSPEAAGCFFSASFHVKDYNLYLLNLTLLDDNTSPKSFDYADKLVPYHGALLVGNTQLKDYVSKGYGAQCFSYKNVYELIFENGFLITTIDHSKAMLRIRKNLELGLRSLTKKRDERCITHFIRSTFIGHYKPFSSMKSRLRYIHKLKTDYQTGNMEP
ncbi:MAG: hypothetical protein K0S76_2357 [Herbinix sp.]|jgi:hypothetical protein|nr:hypothetical protein [Herbinix sp.]